MDDTQDPHRSPVPQVGAETSWELQAEQKDSWTSFACPFLSLDASGLGFVSLQEVFSSQNPGFHL